LLRLADAIAVTVAANPRGTTTTDAAGVNLIFPDMNAMSTAVYAAVVAYNSALVAVVRKATLSAIKAVNSAMMPGFAFSRST
jgi:hypothetical protein